MDYEPTSTLKEDMKYLVQNEDDQNNDAIISDITELTLIDPASGSGHILVTGFELLFKMYREEGYTAKQAVDNILANNLYGLDIDDRAMQLARFAVLLKAAQFDADILNRGIIPHVYSFPEEKHFTSEEVQVFLGHEGQQFTAELKEALQLLNQGKNIGSALKVELSDEAQSYIKKQYTSWVQKYQNATLDIQQQSVWNRLLPFLDVLLVLTKKYTAVVVNPPYMVSGNMNENLKIFVENKYPLTKGDLFTVFMDVAHELLIESGIYGMINQTSWMFKSSYKDFRKSIQKYYNIKSLLHLGPRVFEEISGEVVQSAAFTVQKDIDKKQESDGVYFRLVNFRSGQSKKMAFLDRKIKPFLFNTKNINLIPDSIFAYWLSENGLRIFKSETKLSKVGDVKKGIATGKDSIFIRYWFEIKHRDINFDSIPLACSISLKWLPVNKGGGFRKWSGNFENIINWEKDGFKIKNFKNEMGRLRSRPQNLEFSFKEGITYNIVSSKGFTGRLTDYPSMMCDVGPTIFNLKSKHYVLGLLNSVVGQYFLDALCPGYKYDTGAVGKTPVINEQNLLLKTEKISINNVSISKTDWDSRETSWDFEKSPLLNSSSSLAQAYETWEENVTNDFFQLHANEEELNRIFIDIYGLQEELTPEVALKDITILQEELDRKALEALEPTFRNQGKEAVHLPINKAEVISQFISYGIGVFLGRYRLDKPGLNIAHPNPSDEEVAKYTFNSHEIEIDEDGILPLMGEDCAFPDDILVRTKEFIQAIWGEDSLTENINFIHDALGMDLHKWLVEKFWNYHTSMYKKKPIYWLFSSNMNKPQNAAFKVLVYMHRMDKYTVQKIQRNYLYPHQEHIKREIEKLSENESNLSKSEMKRLEQLRNWEIECRDYNEVLKALANQQIEFDLDDGVSVNYAKFAGAVAKI